MPKIWGNREKFGRDLDLSQTEVRQLDENPVSLRVRCNLGLFQERCARKKRKKGRQGGRPASEALAKRTSLRSYALRSAGSAFWRWNFCPPFFSPERSWIWKKGHKRGKSLPDLDRNRLFEEIMDGLRRNQLLLMEIAENTWWAKGRLEKVADAHHPNQK